MFTFLFCLITDSIQANTCCLLFMIETGCFSGPSMFACVHCLYWLTLNSSPPEQNGCHFADDVFKYIFVDEKSSQILLKFVPEGPIDNNTALVQVLGTRQAASHYLNQCYLPSSLMHICGTRGRWVKQLGHFLQTNFISSISIWFQQFSIIWSTSWIQEVKDAIQLLAIKSVENFAYATTA